MLKSRWLQPEANGLFKVEHEVHVVHGLSAGTFQEIVNAGDDKQFVSVLLQVDETFVSVHHLFQIDVFLHDVHERILSVILFIHTLDFFQCHLRFHHQCGKDAAREVTAVGDEVYFRVKAVLQLTERLFDFGHVLVFESLVNADIVITPTEMARCPGFTPAPVEPVMALTEMSSLSIKCLASGSKPNWMHVAKHPGLATCLLRQMVRRFSSGRP